jgi:DNA-binding HxlR family transcriptional regulator
MGRSADYSKQRCAVAATLDIIGEPWTLLIIRDAFGGTARFEQWQDKLGLARNVLAARLKSLVRQGIFEQRLYCERPKRYEYLLTDKGQELRPLIVHMVDWGTRHVYGGETPNLTMVHKPCGHSLTTIMHCAHCAQAVDHAEIQRRQNVDAKSLAELLKADAVN